MALGIVYLDNRDVEADFSFIVDGLTGFPGMLASAPRDVPVLEGPETIGALLDPRLIRGRPGRATITGRIQAASIAAALTALDALKAQLGEGEVRVRTVYAPDRECLAILDSHEGVAYQKELVNGLVSAALSFTVKDGLAYRINPEGYALSTARTSCPIGTAPSYPVFLVHGGGGTLTNPVVTIRNAAGDSVQTMGFTVSLGANDFLRIDSARAAVDKVSAGTITDGASLLTSGDYPLLRPGDGWVEGAVYPTVELAASAGTPSGRIDYSRRYR